MAQCFSLPRDLGLEYGIAKTPIGARREEETSRGDTDETHTEGAVPAPE